MACFDTIDVLLLPERLGFEGPHGHQVGGQRRMDLFGEGLQQPPAAPAPVQQHHHTPREPTSITPTVFIYYELEQFNDLNQWNDRWNMNDYEYINLAIINAGITASVA